MIKWNAKLYFESNDRWPPFSKRFYTQIKSFLFTHTVGKLWDKHMRTTYKCHESVFHFCENQNWVKSRVLWYIIINSEFLLFAKKICFFIIAIWREYKNFFSDIVIVFWYTHKLTSLKWTYSGNFPTTEWFNVTGVVCFLTLSKKQDFGIALLKMTVTLTMLWPNRISCSFFKFIAQNMEAFYREESLLIY